MATDIAKKIKRLFPKPTVNKNLLTRKKPDESKIQTTVVTKSETSEPQELIVASQNPVSDCEPKVTPVVSTELNELEVVSKNGEYDLEINTFVNPLPISTQLKTSEDNCTTQKDDVKPNVSSTVKPFARSRIKAIPHLGQRRVGPVVSEIAIQSEGDSSNKFKGIGTESELELVSKSSECDIETDKFVIPTSIMTKLKAAAEESTAQHEMVKMILSSPVKTLGRSRIKATPRLGQRRVSSYLYGSASESEDDLYKKYKRIRTESASSANGVPETTNKEGAEAENQEKEKDSKSKIFRKFTRSDETRKIAEARRNFILKYGKMEPENKQKLTIFEHLYYKPTTEPMSQKPVKKLNSNKDEQQSESTESIQNKENETAVDDPVEDEDNDDIPAPQIKIGHNGEIIIDEQSLIVENAQTKKSRRELQNSDIVDGDFDTGYGVFKRVKRTKDWNHVETVYFYKALSALGPDFALMEKYFCNRSRRDLKMKFKKEEKINGHVVNEILAERPLVNMQDLRHNYEMQKLLQEPDPEISKLIKESGKQLREKKKRPKGEAIPKKKTMYSRLIKGGKSIWESSSDEEAGPIVPLIDYKRKPKRTRKSKKKDVEIEPVEPTIIKPTRSGRIPKRRQQFDSEKSVVEEPSLDNPSSFTNMQPGSLMVFTYPSDTGEPCYKVFMVTDKQIEPSDIAPNVQSITETGESNIVNPVEGDVDLTSEHAIATIGNEVAL